MGPLELFLYHLKEMVYFNFFINDRRSDIIVIGLIMLVFISEVGYEKRSLNQ